MAFFVLGSMGLLLPILSWYLYALESAVLLFSQEASQCQFRDLGAHGAGRSVAGASAVEAFEGRGAFTSEGCGGVGLKPGREASGSDWYLRTSDLKLLFVMPRAITTREHVRKRSYWREPWKYATFFFSI